MNWGLLLLLGSAEPDPRPEAGPTSGKNYDCSQKMTQRQGKEVCSLRQDQDSQLNQGTGSGDPEHGCANS